MITNREPWEGVMRARSLLVVVALGAISGYAAAATWVPLQVPDLSVFRVSVDTSSVVVTDGIRRVWFKFETMNMRTLELHAYNCKTREMRVEDLVMYLNDELQPNPSNAKPSRWFNPAPESHQETEMAFACKLQLRERPR
jgi:hypothetical protein